MKFMLVTRSIIYSEINLKFLSMLFKLMKYKEKEIKDLKAQLKKIEANFDKRIKLSKKRKKRN